MLKQHLSFTGLLLLTLTICTACMKTNSNFFYSHSENIKKIYKRPFQIQPIDITTIDRKVRIIHCYPDPHFSNRPLFRLGTASPTRLPWPHWSTAWPWWADMLLTHHVSCVMYYVSCIVYHVQAREAREAAEDRQRLRARVLELEAELAHLEGVRALDIFNSLDRREGK